MNVFLSAVDTLGNRYHEQHFNELNNWNVLASFFTIPKWQCQYIAKYKNFMLDSGAFSFIKSSINIDWDEYVYNYCNFINKFNVKLYIEFDIDNIIGLSEVEKLRTYIDTHTSQKCIPVFHKERGKDYFEYMCKNYPYVAFGGYAISGKKIRAEMEKYIPYFIKKAHEYGAKIHGLGYTSIAGLSKNHFDSVDSTTWIGGKFAEVAIYKNGNIEKHRRNKRGLTKKINEFNFQEWIKFNNYAEKKL